jgi:predicted nucleic acid-binding protein
MNRVVLDCAFAMAWCFEDEANPRADELLAGLVHGSAIVPAIWPLEVANVMLVAQRKGRITLAKTLEFLALLAGLPIVVDPHGPQKAWSDILSLARAHRLSAYDAAYLELAIREHAVLATPDAALRGAAQAVGVALY